MSRGERRARKFMARTRLGDSPNVFVYCDGTVVANNEAVPGVRHAQRVPVAEFQLTTWTNVGESSTFWQITDGGRAHEAMVGDTPLLQSSNPGSPERRVRYRLRCHTCGVEVQVRQEKLEQILNQLHTGGVSLLSLYALDGLL